VDTVPTKVCAFCGPQPHGKPCRVVLCATPESTSCALVSWEVGKVGGGRAMQKMGGRSESTSLEFVLG